MLVKVDNQFCHHETCMESVSTINMLLVVEPRRGSLMLTWPGPTKIKAGPVRGSDAKRLQMKSRYKEGSKLLHRTLWGPNTSSPGMAASITRRTSATVPVAESRNIKERQHLASSTKKDKFCPEPNAWMSKRIRFTPRVWKCCRTARVSVPADCMKYD